MVINLQTKYAHERCQNLSGEKSNNMMAILL